MAKASDTESLIAAGLEGSNVDESDRDNTVREPTVISSLNIPHFVEEPVPLNVFIEDAAYLNNPALSPIQYDAVRHIEQVYLPETHEALARELGPAWDPVRFINFAWIQWGKGSGKDHVCRVAVARAVYLLLCLDSPQKYFGMPAQDNIHVLNVASTATQAHRAFFRPLTSLMRKSEWFKDRCDPKEYSIMFDKGVEAVSGHSISEAMEGLNIILGIADEISAFKTLEEVERFAKVHGGREPARTSEGILKMMRTSARTRFPRNFKIAAISYPRFKGDAIQGLTLTGREDNEKYGEESRVYVSGPHATWDVNPRVADKNDFREDYDEDPVMARAMYECKPDFSMNRFFRSDTSIYAAFSREIPPPIRHEFYWGLPDTKLAAQEGGMPENPGWQIRYDFSENLYPMDGAAYAIHADMSIKQDATGISLAHVKSWEEREWEKPDGDLVSEMRPNVKVDAMLRVEADMTIEPAREIQIRWLRQLVYDLINRGFFVGSVTLDNFQSADTIQILQAQGIEAERLSIDRNNDAWNTLRDVMYEGRLDAYWDELVVNEIQALTLLPNGKVDHPPGGSKDVADSVAGAVVGAILLGGDEGEEPVRADLPVDSYVLDSRGKHGWGDVSGEEAWDSMRF